MTNNACSLHLVSNSSIEILVNIQSLSKRIVLVCGKPETQISSLYLIEITCILVILLFLWVHTISDDTTVFVFFEASSYSLYDFLGAGYDWLG